MIFFTSDTHYGHKNIIKYSGRPYHSFQQRPQYHTTGKWESDVEQMNNDMVERWNSVVNENDIVYHLGDVGMGNSNGWAGYIQSLKGYKIVTRGNHDPSVSALKSAGFDEVVEQTYIEFNNIVFWLAHIPLDNSSDKRNLFRPKSKIKYDVALCGHVHNRWKVGPSKEINVGVDQWNMTPVNIIELIEFIKNEVLNK